MNNDKKSNTFVDENGDLIRYVSPAERVWLWLCAIFKALPFVAIFVICGLTLVQLACLFGLCDILSTSPVVMEECLIYVFLMLISGMIQAAGLAIGWWLVETKGIRIKVYPQHLQNTSLPIKAIADRPPISQRSDK